MKSYVVYSLFSLALAVILGAFGAHAWEDILVDHNETFELANDYHIWTSILLLVLVVLFQNYQKSSKVPFILVILGQCFFTGSLYLLSFPKIFGAGIRQILGPMTPIGGMLIIIGLIWSAIIFLKPIIKHQL